MPEYLCQYDGCQTVLSVWTLRDLGTMCNVHAHHDPCIDLHRPVCDEHDTAAYMRPSGVSSDGERITWACSRCTRVNQMHDPYSPAPHADHPWGAIDLVLGLKTSEARAYFASMNRQRRMKSKALKFCLAPDNGYRLTILGEPKGVG